MARLTASVILSLVGNALAGTIPAVIGTEGTTLGPSVTLVGAANPSYISKMSSLHKSETSDITSTVTEAPQLKPRMNSPPEYLTITVVNKHGSPISTSHWRKYIPRSQCLWKCSLLTFNRFRKRTCCRFWCG
jgi:hypothetical protein